MTTSNNPLLKNVNVPTNPLLGGANTTERQTLATPDHQQPISGGQSRRPTGGGSSRRPLTSPQQVYESDLLKQSFVSEEAMKNAEAEYFRNQKTEVQQMTTKQQIKDIQKNNEPKKKIITGEIQPTTEASFLTGKRYTQSLGKSLGMAGRSILKGNFKDAYYFMTLSEKQKVDVPNYKNRPLFLRMFGNTYSQEDLSTQRESQLKAGKEQDRLLSEERKRAEQEVKLLTQQAQSRIFAGEDFEKVSLEHQTELDKINKDFEKNQLNIKKTSGFRPELFERTGTTSKVLKGAELVGVVGSGFINPAIPTGYIIGKGLVQLSRPTPKEDIIATGGLFSTKQDELFAREYSKRREGAINLAIGGAFAPSMSFRAGRDILQSELKTLTGEKLKFGELVVGQDKGQTFLKGVQRSGGLRRDVTIFGDFTRTNKDILVSKGLGGSSITGTFQSQLPTGWTSGVGQKSIISGEIFNVGAKSPLPIKMNNVFLSTSKQTYQPLSQQAKIFDTNLNKELFSFSKKGGKSIISFGSGASREVEPSTFRGIYGETIFDKKMMAQGFNPNSFGTTLNIAPSSKTSFVGGLGKSSKDVGGSSLITSTTQKTALSFSGSASKSSLNLQSQTFRPVVSSIYTGTGQYERTTSQLFSPSLKINVQSSETQKSLKTQVTTNQLQTTQRRRSINIVSPRLNTQPNTGIRTDSIISPALRSDSRQRQIQRLTGSTALRPFIPRTPRTSIGSSMTPPPFFKIPRPFGVGGGMSLRDFGGTRRFRYTPSFKALVLNIKGTRPKKPKKRRYTGLELRPIIGRRFFS